MVPNLHSSLLAHRASWNDVSGHPTPVTFSFAADGPAGSVPFSAAQRASARLALAAWDSVSGISVVEVPDAPGGTGIDIRFRLEDLGSVARLGLASLPPLGDVALNAVVFRADSLAPSATRIGHQVLLHEIGHALGLAHPAVGLTGAAANTIMLPVLGQTRPANAPLLWDREAVQDLYGTPEAEAALGLRWSWDATLEAVRGDGTARADLLTGTAHRDALFGGAGHDLLQGLDGDDLLVPGPGNDVVEGGAGHDVLRLGVLRHDLRFNPAGNLESPEGRDRFSGIEALELRDGTVYLAAPEGLAPLVGLYTVALGRAPDAGGLAFWWADWQADPNLVRIAQGFLNSAEFQAGPASLGGRAAALGQAMPGGTPAEALASLARNTDTSASFTAGLWVADADALLVARLYQLALGRDPEEQGFANWMDAREHGLSAEALAAGFLFSTEAAQHGPLAWATPAALLAEAQHSAWSNNTDGVFFV